MSRWWNKLVQSKLNYTPLSQHQHQRCLCCRSKWLCFCSLITRHRRRLSTSALVIVIAALISYNYITSEFYLLTMEPKVYIQGSERSRCCIGPPSDESIRHQTDMCGRINCLWPCPVKTVGQVVNVDVKDNNAFFHETSGVRWINYRQACAVESLAHFNPNLTVHLLMATGGPDQIDLNRPTMRVLLDNYSNIRLTGVNLGDYMSGSPLERWYFCNPWNRGWFALSHLSDALRFLSLSKFGGYYFDLDVIQLQPITSYRNFVVAEDVNKLGSSVIHVDYQHPFIRMAVEDFPVDYKWFVWAHNGPDLVTRILQSWCHVDYVSWMTPDRCSGFRILPSRSFYPVHYFNWRKYFYQRPSSSIISETGEEEESSISSAAEEATTQGQDPSERWLTGDDESVLGAHVWNSYSATWPVSKNSNTYYTQMARRSCPKVFSIAPLLF